MNYNIKNKLAIVKTLFVYCYDTKNNCDIDIEMVNAFTRAWIVACRFLEKTIKYGKKVTLRKDDLIYINKIINKLINILGTDEDKINLKYIEKCGIRIPSMYNKKWPNAYKELLKMVENKKI